MFKYIILCLVLGVFFAFPQRTNAQAAVIEFEDLPDFSTISATIASPSAETAKIEQEDLTRPEESPARREFLLLFQKRPIPEPDFTNLMGYTVQYAVRSGVPANTIILILLMPALATLIVFIRQIIGLPTLEMLVPIALAVTLVATGLVVGIILLSTILIGSMVSRLLLKRIRIMQLPKLATSMMLVSLFVFASLVVAASLRIFDVSDLSFLPVLLFVLLSDKIVSLQFTRGSGTAILITFFTLIIAAFGYFILSYPPIRNTVLLYPELILLLIPLNVMVGRYFGLRLTEFYKFSPFRKYVDQ